MGGTRFLYISRDSARKGERMPSSNRPSQPRQNSDTNKNDLNPLTFPQGQGKRKEQWAEDDLLAEDDPLASDSPRPPSSTIRCNNPTTARPLTRDMTPQPPPHPLLIPPRLTTPTYTP